MFRPVMPQALEKTSHAVQLRVVNPLDCPDWNERIDVRRHGSFFNTVEWARVLSSSYGFEPCYIVGEEDGDIVSLLPMMHVGSWLTGRRGVSLPFSDYSEPVGMDSSRASLIMDALMDLGRRKKWRYFEVRCADGVEPGTPASAVYRRHSLNLVPGEKVLFESLESSVRTSIRKALKAGVEVTFSDTLEALGEFYRLNCLTRRRHGLPPQPFSFFKNLHQQVLAKGLGLVATARHGGNVIAASVYCHVGRKALFKYGASDTRYQGLRGSTLVMWDAIRRYAGEGYETLSLGRTAVANEGLRRFKLGWGATETELRYFNYDLRRGQFVGGGCDHDDTGYALVRLLPLSCSRLVGTLLYKHIA